MLEASMDELYEKYCERRVEIITQYELEMMIFENIIVVTDDLIDNHDKIKN